MKRFFLYSMALLYVLAGINHFLHPTMYLKIMPLYIPFHKLLVSVSGVCEIVFGVLLIPSFTRTIAAWLIVALLIAVFPANIQMAFDQYHHHDPMLWLGILRLPLQGLLIWWAWTYTKPPH